MQAQDGQTPSFPNREVVVVEPLSANHLIHMSWIATTDMMSSTRNALRKKHKLDRAIH